ncbi:MULTISPECIES: CBASS cGAMP synthase [Aeromonas]|uniref:CBASS cGAMP synthase n=1 Tax=Aeromonas TaxID=642 RepID=UPI0005A68285|nr:hypothetical protein [Aeromonas caviae]MBS4634982.1 hypothetical protein [Aeromonas caviae]WQD87672.1 CBASS cGAMP synthase [Aeromonas caviae]SQH60141.1 Uncharacterised protein [Aeromonas caviae]
MPNFSSLLYTTTQERCFLNELDLTTSEYESIDSARKLIRDTLKAQLPSVLKEKGFQGNMREPRFFIQGSRAYKTLNRPCITPPQQSDIDDGVYLPMTTIQEEERPSLAIETFFEAVVEVLEPLADKQGWKISQKDTCVRAVISDAAHIDLPLYAIPDAQFVLLKAMMESRGCESLKDVAMDASNDNWSALPSDKILLAHKTEGWIESDPRAMKSWFVQQVSDKGEQLRRVVRYIKAFRDFQWPTRGPSSILLMAASCPLFKQFDRRDDIALLEVVKGIPKALQEGVLNPVDSTKYLTGALSREEIQDAVERFTIFAEQLEEAINSMESIHACKCMTATLGKRFPNEPDRMKVSNEELPAAIASYLPERGPSEKIQRTKAG